MILFSSKAKTYIDYAAQSKHFRRITSPEKARTRVSKFYQPSIRLQELRSCSYMQLASLLFLLHSSKGSGGLRYWMLVFTPSALLRRDSRFHVSLQSTDGLAGHGLWIGEIVVRSMAVRS